MIDMFVKRPAMTVMFVLVFVVLGIVSYFNLIIESTPKVEFPIVSIKAVYFGASPEEIETQIIKKIEDAIAEISQIKKIESQAAENFGFIFIEFETEADVNIKSIEVKDKVEPILNDLPKDAEKPEISKFDPLVEPILDLVLTSDAVDARTLYEYADKNLKNVLATTEGVANVDIVGGEKRQINVFLDPFLMKKYFLAISDVTDSISKQNVNIPGGTIDKINTTSSVRLVGEYDSVNEIKQTIIVSPEGRQIQLRDIATVEDAAKKVESYTRFNNTNVVGMSLKKLSDGDAVSIVKEVKKAIHEINKTLPESMDLVIAFDSTQFILSDTKNTLINILFGIILTIGILFFFLGDWRVTVVAGVVIPTSIISSCFLIDMSEFSINFMTLLAIATSLGTLIANALVVIENVDLHLSYGKDSKQAAIDGTKEAAVAVMASAGTNLVVFTPMAFMGGMVGQFMQQFGLTVVYATIFSIIASFSLTPMMCALLLKTKKEQTQENKSHSIWSFFRKTADRLIAFLVGEYKHIFNGIMAHPGLTGMFCFLLLIGSCYPASYVGNELMPGSDQDKIIIRIEMSQGTLLEKTKSVVEDIEKMISDLPEVKNYLSYIGIDGPENGKIIINLVKANTREKSDMDIIYQLTPQVAGIPDAEISFSRGESGPSGADITVNVTGPDYKKMIGLADTMKEIMTGTGYFRSIKSSYKVPKDEIRFIPDKKAMTAAGAKNDDVGFAMRSAITGNDENIYKEKGEEYTIQVEYDDFYAASLDDIRDISVMTRDGLVPISALGQVKQAPGYSVIQRRDKKRIIQLNGFLSKSTAGNVQKILDDKFNIMGIPKGYTYKYAGNAEFQDETNQELGRAFLLAIILTYMLLVAILNSFTYPFVIVSSIATSFAGVFLILFFNNHSMNIGSQMTMIMLVGLVVNSAILMLDYTLKRLDEGSDITEALWLGASVKFRAILMTSLAIIFGALPQLFDTWVVKASMGAVIVGGILASIFFTFILIPVAFKYTYILVSFVKKKFA